MLPARRRDHGGVFAAGDMMVVSAAGSTTNQLISWLKLSQTDRLSAHQVQQSLRRYQSELIAVCCLPRWRMG
jgi:aspartokinase